ncbi:MAG TPA: hypothetical protein VI357_18440 [Mycobacteriales bacterium]
MSAPTPPAASNPQPDGGKPTPLSEPMGGKPTPLDPTTKGGKPTPLDDPKK